MSVVMATYNWSTVLPYSIGSALDQTLRDIEVIVVGDGCTDDTAEVIASLGDGRLRFVNRTSRTGHQWTPNNTGVELATGTWIAYLGHDDLWLPRHLELLVAGIESSGCGWGYALSHVVRPDQTARLHPPASAGDRMSIPPTSFIHQRSLTSKLGGWRSPADCFPFSPEHELQRRFRANGHQPVEVHRLTSVKVPALWRRDVYATRPSHEQRMWSARIRTEADLEAHLLGEHVRSTNPRDALRATIRRHIPAPLWYAKIRAQNRNWHARALRRKGAEMVGTSEHGGFGASREEDRANS